MGDLDHYGEVLPIGEARPAALAANSEIIVVAVLFDVSFEGRGRALNRALLARLRPGRQ